MSIQLSPEQRAVLERVLKDFRAAEKVHQKFQESAEHRYALYRSYRADKDRYKWRQARDIYPQTPELVSTWGAELFVPKSFATVETVLPRIISHGPKMQVFPRPHSGQIDSPDEMDRLFTNAGNMRDLINAQQSQADYELVLQEIAKNALIYGLGVQKTGWDTRKKSIKRLVSPAGSASSQWTEQVETRKLFDGPMAWSVDPIAGFFWDPLATNVDNAEYLFHRTFRSQRYVQEKIESGAWTGLTVQDIPSGGGKQQYEKAYEQRMNIGGYAQTARSDVHEILEYHDGDNVVIVLDQMVPVVMAENPWWHGEKPFQTNRPQVVPGEFVGIGVIEPIEDLQHELNALRRQRRDNATLALQRPAFYQDGMIDPDDVEWGPGKWNPTLGDPKESVFFPVIPDIPNSSVNEEAALNNDFDRTSGLSDTASGQTSTGDTTATEVQMVIAQMNARIQNMAKLLEKQVIKPGCRQWMFMDQQKVTEQNPMVVRVEGPPEPGSMTPMIDYRKLGPLELTGDFELEPEGGATQPDNVPQDRADFQSLMGLMNNPEIDQRHLLTLALQKLGIKQPEALLAPQEPAVPRKAVELLVNAGHLDANLANTAVAMAMRESQGPPQLDQPEQGPPDQAQPNGNGVAA